MTFFTVPDWFFYLEVVWVLAVSAYILTERRPPLATVAWIVTLASLPIIGLLVYYFLGPRSLERKRRRRVVARAAKRSRSSGSRPNRASAVDSLGTAGARIAAVAAGVEQSPPLPARTLDLYDGGCQTYTAILEAIAAARHHVHLEYYIFEEGVVARRIRDALVERAKAGVQVRLLLDGLGSKRMGGFLQPMRDAGVHVARFGPRMRPGFVNFRTHRKIVVCDGTTGFTGGINIDDCHDASVVGPDDCWRDTHARITGDAVAPLALAFLEDWQYATDEVLDGLEFLPELNGAGTELVQICASGPDAHPQSIHAVYFTAITSAQQRVWISTPYFVPDESMQSALSSAALRGVDVRVLIPVRSDQRLADAAARSYFPELLAAGVRLFLYGPPPLHAKTLVIDGDAAIVGSANLDNRSLRLNFEAIAVCYGREPVELLAAMYERDLLRSSEVTVRDIKRLSIPSKLVEGAARLFSPML
ncbi:MAG TPA: cardiolipin synthase [Gemmatimonadaceae bacterium]|nr:cardiolipin synthase [Gemmatimonadaceae bacterium]